MVGGVEVVCKAQEHKLTCKAVCQGGTERPGGILAGWVGGGERRSDCQGHLNNGCTVAWCSIPVPW